MESMFELRTWKSLKFCSPEESWIVVAICIHSENKNISTPVSKFQTQQPKSWLRDKKYRRIPKNYHLTHDSILSTLDTVFLYTAIDQVKKKKPALISQESEMKKTSFHQNPYKNNSCLYWNTVPFVKSPVQRKLQQYRSKSYIKDSEDFIRKIKDIQYIPSNAIVAAAVADAHNLQVPTILDSKAF